MKLLFKCFILLTALFVCNFPVLKIYAEDVNDDFLESYHNTEFDIDYVHTGSDETYNYFTVWVTFSNPDGCNFSFNNIYFCTEQRCVCSVGQIGSCDKNCIFERTDFSSEYTDGILKPTKVSMTYTVKTPVNDPVYRFSYYVSSMYDDTLTRSWNCSVTPILPDITPSVTPEPTAVPSVSPEPTTEPTVTPLPSPSISVSIDVAYSGDEYTVSSTGKVVSDFEGSAVLEIWCRGYKDRCFSNKVFESGTTSITFSSDRFSPYTKFYGKITYTYTDSEGTELSIIKFTDDLTIEFREENLPSGQSIGNLKDLIYYIWNVVFEAEITYEGFTFTFKGIFLFMFFAIASIIFIKRLLGD